MLYFCAPDALVARSDFRFLSGRSPGDDIHTSFSLRPPKNELVFGRAGLPLFASSFGSIPFNLVPILLLRCFSLCRDVPIESFGYHPYTPLVDKGSRTVCSCHLSLPASNNSILLCSARGVHKRKKSVYITHS